MADNYIERMQQEAEARRAAKQRAASAQWKKRLKAYQNKLKKENNG